MRNILILFTFSLTFILSVIIEPIDDVIDTFAGGTNTTYQLTIDSYSGASDEYEDDEHEDEYEDDD